MEKVGNAFGIKAKIQSLSTGVEGTPEYISDTRGECCTATSGYNKHTPQCGAQ